LKRAFIIILDGCGVGELPDAGDYGDRGSNTLGNLSRAVPGGLALPNLGALGLGNIIDIQGVPPQASALGFWGKMAEQSAGKDSTSGHWELAGLVTVKPFPTYPQGFPRGVLDAFRKAIGRGILGNKAASGTEIIAELGDEHVATGRPIVYTSADSVFQIACHQETVALEQLYDWCRKARGILAGEHAVGRVIARPFIGVSGNYQRVGGNRKDFSLTPPKPTLLDGIKESGRQVVGVGKICDLYAGRGLTECLHSDDNRDGMAKFLGAVPKLESGLLMMNLVEFDMTWGHRNDVPGFHSGLREFDAWLPELMSAMAEGDILFMTADHGNDPTTPSTDHSREYVPLLAWGPGLGPGTDLGTRSSMADLAATAAEAWGIKGLENGNSFWKEIRSV
jgi:phosphopentomutase